MDLVFAYLAGLLTLINPCVLPVLPIVLASALQVSPLGPIVLATGMGMSFVAVGMAVLSFGQVIGINNDDVAQLGALGGPLGCCEPVERGSDDGKYFSKKFRKEKTAKQT